MTCINYLLGTNSNLKQISSMNYQSGFGGLMIIHISKFNVFFKRFDKSKLRTELTY